MEYEGGIDVKKLFEIADRYVQESDWKDLALIKLCLCAMGIMIGLRIAPKYKRTVMIGATAVFTATYIPLMTKFFQIVFRKTER